MRSVFNVMNLYWACRLHFTIKATQCFESFGFLGDYKFSKWARYIFNSLINIVIKNNIFS